MTDQTTEIIDVKRVNSTAIESINRAEVDIQITTAKEYPRDLAACLNDALAMATIDEDTAAGCFYNLPPRKGSGGKSITGPSVRLAEIVFHSWGNLRSATRLVESTQDNMLTAQATAIDLEKNNAIQVEIERPTVTKHGTPYGPDMIKTTAAAATAIAWRNAIFKIIPRSFAKTVENRCRAIAVGDVQTLGDRRAKVIERFQKFGITQDRILKKLSLNSVGEISPAHLEELIGYGTAIKDGHTTIEEVFPETQDAPAAGTKADTLVQKLETKPEPAVHPTQRPEMAADKPSTEVTPEEAEAVAEPEEVIEVDIAPKPEPTPQEPSLEPTALDDMIEWVASNLSIDRAIARKAVFLWLASKGRRPDELADEALAKVTFNAAKRATWDKWIGKALIPG